MPGRIRLDPVFADHGPWQTEEVSRKAQSSTDKGLADCSSTTTAKQHDLGAH